MASPRRADPHADRVSQAKAHFFAGQYQRAEAEFRRILAASRDHPHALHFLGVIAYLHHQYPDAIDLMRRAVPRLRGDSELHSNLGLALQADGDFDAAISSFSRAVRLAPRLGIHHAYLAGALRDSGALDAAITECNRALALHPDLPLARYNRALCSLLAGQWSGLWADYEWRIASDSGLPYLPDPRAAGAVLPRPSEWANTDLSDKRILVLNDQGIGDELFFLRFAPAVRERCSWLGYRTSGKLAAILQTASGLDEVFCTEDSIAETPDLVLAASDLALLSEPYSNAQPPPAIDLAPHPKRLGEAQHFLTTLGPPPYLALTWRAGASAQAGQRPARRKSVPLARLAEAIKHWPGTLVSVQREARPEELRDLGDCCGRPIADAGRANEELDRMLALMAGFDDYVGVSNTNMYLRAAAGRTAHVLVSIPPDWRWTEHAAESPWFPGFRLYRENRESGWGEALGRLNTRLSG